MEYKIAIRNIIRLYRYIGSNDRKNMKTFVKLNLGYWNGATEEYYHKAIVHTLMNDSYQKTDAYRSYRRKYEAAYRKKYRGSRSADVAKCNYKKRYGGEWEVMYKQFLERKAKRANYVPMFLQWCTSYKQEVDELINLIKTNPTDLNQLKREYKKLTGVNYNSRGK